MADESEDKRKLEDTRFRAMLVASNLDKAQEILAVLDGEEVVDEFAPELTDEEMEEFEGYSADEIQANIEALRRFGLAVS